MESVKLKVTSKVIAQSKKAVDQEQIAISEFSGSLKPAIAQANKQNRIRIVLAGALEFELGDTGAIWRAHNVENKEGFDALFGCLSRFPDTDFEFVCALA